MTIPVQIEHGNHTIAARLHALPRVGDKITCAFPSSGLPKLSLVVTSVNHHQLVSFDGKECPEPFTITVTTEGDPMFEAQNRAAFEKVLKGGG